MQADRQKYWGQKKLPTLDMSATPDPIKVVLSTKNQISNILGDLKVIYDVTLEFIMQID